MARSTDATAADARMDRSTSGADRHVPGRGYRGGVGRTLVPRRVLPNWRWRRGNRRRRVWSRRGRLDRLGDRSRSITARHTAVVPGSRPAPCASYRSNPFSRDWRPCKPAARSASLMNSARYPSASSPRKRRARCQRRIVARAAACSESRSSMPNSATADAKPRLASSARRVLRTTAVMSRLVVAVRRLVAQLHGRRAPTTRPHACVVGAAAGTRSGSTAARPPSTPAGTISYSAVTVWPAPISPASFLSSLKSSFAQHAVLVADQPVGRDRRRG